RRPSRCSSPPRSTTMYRRACGAPDSTLGSSPMIEESPSTGGEEHATGEEEHATGEEEHADDGLDLARSIARGYQSSPRRQAGSSRRSNRKSRRRTTQASGAHPDDRDPQSLGSTVDRLVFERGWQGDLAVHALFARWEAIVGAQVAQHCRPTGFDDGVLMVAADSTSWATQLRWLASTVVAKMNDQLGDGTVVRIKVTGPAAPSWKKGIRSVPGRG